MSYKTEEQMLNEHNKDAFRSEGMLCYPRHVVLKAMREATRQGIKNGYDRGKKDGKKK